MFLSSLTINLESDGAVRGVIADYAEKVGDRDFPFGTRQIAAADIEAHLPTTAALLAQIAALQADLAAETKAREAAELDRDTKLAAAQARIAEEVAQAQAAKDAASAMSGVIAAKDAVIVTLEAQVASLTAATERSIHKAYLRAALADIGRLADVDAAVQAAGPVKWELWANATAISQDDPDVNAIADALGIDLAAVFTAARAIRTARGG